MKLRARRRWRLRRRARDRLERADPEDRIRFLELHAAFTDEVGDEWAALGVKVFGKPFLERDHYDDVLSAAVAEAAPAVPITT